MASMLKTAMAKAINGHSTPKVLLPLIKVERFKPNKAIGEIPVRVLRGVV